MEKVLKMNPALKPKLVSLLDVRSLENVLLGIKQSPNLLAGDKYWINRSIKNLDKANKVVDKVVDSIRQKHLVIENGKILQNEDGTFKLKEGSSYEEMNSILQAELKEMGNVELSLFTMPFEKKKQDMLIITSKHSQI